MTSQPQSLDAVNPKERSFCIDSFNRREVPVNISDVRPWLGQRRWSFLRVIWVVSLKVLYS